ncbi:FHA domain-containing protein [Fontivita pretiosa]|uniref:FHA domain-containing protein n=1 Tax=Fontivita pretiosa TaxID=2989684 RepID=UPI003D17C3CB
MQVVLAMFRSDGDRRSFSLHKDVTVIGRKEDCDLRIALGDVSRKHCRLIKQGQTLKLEDLGSSNGTFHNGRRVQEAIIQPGDTIQVGSIAFVVQLDGLPPDEELVPRLAVPVAELVKNEGSGQAESVEDSGIPTGTMDADASHRRGNGNGQSDATTARPAAEPAEFDPMSVLENSDSQVPADAMVIDLEQSHHGQQA